MCALQRASLELIRSQSQFQATAVTADVTAAAVVAKWVTLVQASEGLSDKQQEG